MVRSRSTARGRRGSAGKKAKLSSAATKGSITRFLAVSKPIQAKKAPRRHVSGKENAPRNDCVSVGDNPRDGTRKRKGHSDNNNPHTPVTCSVLCTSKEGGRETACGTSVRTDGILETNIETCKRRRKNCTVGTSSRKCPSLEQPDASRHSVMTRVLTVDENNVSYPLKSTGWTRSNQVAQSVARHGKSDHLATKLKRKHEPVVLVHSNSAGSPRQKACCAGPGPLSGEAPRVGLVRATFSADTLRLSEQSRVHELKKGDILGRTANVPITCTPRMRRSKLPLGIGREADGVSREHAKVVKVTAKGIILKCSEKAMNAIRIVPFGDTGAKAPEISNDDCTLLCPGNAAFVNVGDFIAMDAYQSVPSHVFRVILMGENHVAASSVKRQRVEAKCDRMGKQKMPISTEEELMVSQRHSEREGSINETQLEDCKHRSCEQSSSHNNIPAREAYNHVRPRGKLASNEHVIVPTNDLSVQPAIASDGFVCSNLSLKETPPRCRQISSGSRVPVGERDPCAQPCILASGEKVVPTQTDTVDYTVDEPVHPSTTGEDCFASSNMPPQATGSGVSNQTCGENSKGFNNHVGHDTGKDLNIKRDAVFAHDLEPVDQGLERCQLNLKDKRIPKGDDVGEVQTNDGAEVSRVEGNSCIENHRIDIPFRVGDRLRVEFKVNNPFGVKISEWYFGSLVSVIEGGKKSHLMNIVYDDKQNIQYKWPNKREKIEKLLPLECGVVRCAETKTVAYVLPTVLYKGDLVDCLFQYGGENGTWFRGRVADVQESLNGSQFCDVAYYDGEYECNVPVKGEHIHLVSRGFEEADWVIGSQFTDKKRGKVCKATVAKRATQSNRQAEKLKFEVRFGRRDWEVRSYEEVIEKLLVEARQKAEAARKIWYWPKLSSSAINKDQVSFVDTACPEDHLPRPIQMQTIDANCDLGAESKLRLQDEIIVESTKTDFTSLSKSKLVSPVPDDDSAVSKCLPGHNIVDDHLLSAPELQTSLSNLLWRCINSAEPHNGTLILTELLNSHSKAPNPQLSKNIVDLVMKGPQSEGHRYHDPNKSELVMAYAALVCRKFPASKYCNGATSLFPSWDEIEYALESVSKANCNCSATGSHRISEALQQASYAMRFLCVLIARDVQEAKEGTFSDREKLKSSPGRNLFLCPAGLRGALKCFVRYSMRYWIQNGHFVCSPQMNSMNQRCAFSANCLMNSMGMLTGFVSWLFCLDEAVDGDSKVISLLFEEIILSEICSSSLNATQQKSVLLLFLGTLDDELCGKLRISLGKQLRLTKKDMLILC